MDQVTSLPVDQASQPYSSVVDTMLSNGENSLLKGDLIHGIEFFEKATALDPDNPMMHLRQAIAFFEYGSEPGHEKWLAMACKKFKNAHNAGCISWEMWHLWGNSLLLQGLSFKQLHYFIAAEEKYCQALSNEENQKSGLLADLLWDYGIIWSQIAKYSGEAIDLQQAIDSFLRASSLHDHLPSEFWIDFGQACFDLAGRINDIRLYVKAIHCLKHGVSQSLSCFKGWSMLASALQMLYHHTHDEDHFSQANECYAAAAQLRPQEIGIWLNWASFLCDSGMRNQDVKRLYTCVEKCHRAASSQHDHPSVLAVWAKALAAIGMFAERLDLIYEAQNKIAQASQLSHDDPEIYCSYGYCLYALGHYFNDADYYYQAIEKFQVGLSCNRTYHQSWHGIAKTYTTIGLLTADIEVLQRSQRFYLKAIELSLNSFYLFDYAFALSKLGEMIHEQEWLEESILQLEKALNIQKNAVYLHPEWLFLYACTLDMLGDFFEEESYYVRAIDIFSHVLMIDPDFPQLHHRLSLAYSHLGELLGEIEQFYKAIHHFRLAHKYDAENDQIILDWGLTLINIAEHIGQSPEQSQLYCDAEHKLMQAARDGNVHSYYHLAGLYSLLGQYERAMSFIERADAIDALPALEEILQDDWLENLRNSSADYRDFLSQLEQRPILE